jgi:hypothetical protein
MIICNRYLSTRDFSFHAATNCFVTEASDFKDKYFGQVYDDAADEGFVLVSHVTGDSVVCALHHVDTREDEIQGWIYKVVAVQDKEHNGRWKEFRGTVVPPPYNFDVLVIND